MHLISEMTQRKWERRLRSFWIIGGFSFIASILVARPLTESFETMRMIFPLCIMTLFAALMMSALIWLVLQLALAQRSDRDFHSRSRPVQFRRAHQEQPRAFSVGGN